MPTISNTASITAYISTPSGKPKAGAKVYQVKTIDTNGNIIADTPVLYKSGNDGVLAFTAIQNSWIWLRSDIWGMNQSEEGSPFWIGSDSSYDLKSITSSLTADYPINVPVVIYNNAYASTASLVSASADLVSFINTQDQSVINNATAYTDSTSSNIISYVNSISSIGYHTHKFTTNDQTPLNFIVDSITAFKYGVNTTETTISNFCPANNTYHTTRYVHVWLIDNTYTYITLGSVMDEENKNDGATITESNTEYSINITSDTDSLVYWTITYLIR